MPRALALERGLSSLLVQQEQRVIIRMSSKLQQMKELKRSRLRRVYLSLWERGWEALVQNEPELRSPGLSAVSWK